MIAQRTHYAHCGHTLLLAEVYEEYLGREVNLFGEEVQSRHYVVYAVGAERYTHTRGVGHAEYPCQVVVTAAAADRTDGIIHGLDLEYRTRIVVQTACQREVELDGQIESQGLDISEYLLHLGYALKTCLGT